MESTESDKREADKRSAPVANWCRPAAFNRVGRVRFSTGAQFVFVAQLVE